MPKRNKTHQKMINAAKERVKVDKEFPRQKVKKIIQVRITKAVNRHHRTNRTKIISDMKAILNHETTEFVNCPHYLIGAASLDRLCRGKYDMERAHQHLQKKDVIDLNAFHLVGERISEQSHIGGYSQRFRIHPFIPFLCSKADIANKGITIEVKTTGDHKQSKNYNNRIPKSILPQIWQTMECFAENGCEIDVYLYKEHKDIPEAELTKFLPIDPERFRGTFIKSHATTVNKIYSLFDPEMIEFVIDRYLVFLKDYFRSGNLTMTKSIKKEVRKMISDKIIENMSKFKEVSKDPKACQSYLADIASKMRSEQCGEVCFKHKAEDRKRVFNPEGSLIEFVENRYGLVDNYDNRVWKRDYGVAPISKAYDVTREDRNELMESFKKSLGRAPEDTESNEESNTPQFKVEYPRDISLRAIAEWEKNNINSHLR